MVHLWRKRFDETSDIWLQWWVLVANGMTVNNETGAEVDCTGPLVSDGERRDRHVVILYAQKWMFLLLKWSFSFQIT